MSASVDGPSISAFSIASSYGKWRSATVFSQTEAVAAPTAPEESKTAAGPEDLSAASVADPKIDKSGSGGGNREAELDKAMSAANAWMTSNNRSIRFRFHQDLGRMQVQVVDPAKNQVLRSVPSDEMLRFNRRMRDLSGVGAMVDESR